MTDKAVEVGRLAFRVEGENWNAYYAMQNTMDRAIFLASIRLAIVMRSAERKEEFMALMRNALNDMFAATHGAPATWNEPQSAPESERSGHG